MRGTELQSIEKTGKAKVPASTLAARGAGGTSERVLQLQRGMGNRATGQLLHGRPRDGSQRVQRKLNVGADNDPLEREADAAAGTVTSVASPQAVPTQAAPEVSRSAAPVVQRAVMKGATLQARTSAVDPAIANIAGLLTQYRATKGIFKRVTATRANQRFNLLRQIDRAIYTYMSGLSLANEHMVDNPYAAVLHQVLQQTQSDHVALIHKTRNMPGVNPFDQGAMTGGEILAQNALWSSIKGGAGKVKLVGNASHNKKMRSDLAKLIDTPTGRELLTYLDTPSIAETANGALDPLTNTYIGQTTNQLPANVTGPLGGAPAETGVSQSQPLRDADAYMHSPVAHPGITPGTHDDVANVGDVHNAITGGQQGIVHGGQRYDFGAGTGAFVRVVDHGTMTAHPGIAGVDHETYTPRFTTLGHELGHSANQRAGAGAAGAQNFGGLFGLSGLAPELAKTRWDDPEEMLNIINVENRLKGDVGLDQRTSHKTQDGLKRMLRVHHVKQGVIAQFGVDNHEDSFGYMNARSRGLWMTATGHTFLDVMVATRNLMHQPTEWADAQLALLNLIGMNVANEKTQYVQDMYDEMEQLVLAKGGRATLSLHNQGLYDGVVDDVANHLPARMAATNTHLGLINRIMGIQGTCGKALVFPGAGIPVLRW